VPSPLRPARVGVPADAPAGLLNRFTLGLFNEAYYRGQLRARNRATVPYTLFFFPLDGVGDWSRLYGPRGFVQYQCVVPDEPGGGPIRTILERISRSGEPASHAVLKRFGGAVYPAKDARMSPLSFRAFFPQLDRFTGQRDPRFSSSFWRRVHAS
jgi:hypothetical protein